MRTDRWKMATARLGLCAGLAAGATAPVSSLAIEERTTMTEHAKGSFDVKVTPAAIDGEKPVASARLTLDKNYRGDLAGTARGEMWTVDTGVEGSGAYVAIERFEGTLRGRRGTFALVHQGTMRRGGDYRMQIVVVPDSGTGELAGLTGTLTILFVPGGHDYELAFQLPHAPSAP